MVAKGSLPPFAVNQLTEALLIAKAILNWQSVSQDKSQPVF